MILGMPWWLLPLLAIEAALLLPSIYLFILTIVGVFYRPKTLSGVRPKTRFAILVPAHDEEILLPKLLDNLKAVDYPKDRYEIFVVADNCTDSTAEVGRAHGATVLERHDTTALGKGHALRWLLAQLRAAGKEAEAYVFLDADCYVNTNFLRVMDQRFQSGSRVVQAYYTSSNPFESRVAVIRYAALVLMHRARTRGRQVLGLSCGLFGTGMAFKRSVLEAQSWDAYSLAEDVEFYLKLTDRGVKVDFAPEAVVHGDMPTTLKGSKTQNIRWEKGRVQMALKYGPKFFLQGIFGGKLLKLDAALQQSTPPLSITVSLSALLFIAALFTGNSILVGIGLATNLFLLGHVLIGLLSARVPARVYLAFAFMPWFIAWKLFVYGIAMLPKNQQWVRTERTQQH